MDSDDSDDPIDAFFRGEIKGKRKIVQPNFTTQSKKIKSETKEWKREFLDEPSTSAKEIQENILLTKFLNAPIQEIEKDCTLGIKNEDNLQESYLWSQEEKIYQKYEFNLPIQDLPIAKKRKDIIDTVNCNQIIIVKASTGSGKSSQVPQYILENAYKNKKPCNIIITQPRRISAQLLAERVALERKCDVGSLVGYQIGMDKMMDNNDTRILYCTTGVLLQKLVNRKSVANWTHIIIDEIHERDIDMDMVLLILKRIIIVHRPQCKVILMSATMNCEKISNYFQIIQPVPILNLEIPRTYHVKIQYLDDISYLGVSHQYIDMNNPGIHHEMYKIGVSLIDLLVQKGVKTFLIFLPGMYEIECFARELNQEQRKLDINEFKIITLHSMISPSKFPELHNSEIKKKIILSTNIAESSVTIKEIDFIIDYCLTKYIEAERDSNVTQLKISWASKMNLIQRAGRTGRTNHGQVVRMIYERHYEELENEPRSEMQRMPLEKVLLKAKQLDMGRPCDILAISLDPPKRNAIIDGILSLKENFALTRYTDGEFNFLDGEMTLVGQIMNKLPIDIRLAKLIVFGYLFSVFKETVIIAAGMSVRSIFHVTRYQTHMSAYETKLRYDSTSDCLAILNVYKKYIAWRNIQKNKIPFGVENEWCNRHMVDIKNLRDMEKQINEIHNRLHEFGMEDDVHEFFNDNEKTMVLKMAIAGAFYPNVYTFGGNIPKRDDFKIVNDKNLYSTVYFKGFPRTRHGYLYENQFRKIIFENQVIAGEMEASFTFDCNSSRVFINFNNGNNDKINMPGEVSLEVYKAVKLRKLSRRGDLSVKVMSLRNQEEFKDNQNMEEANEKYREGNFFRYSIYPNNLTKQCDANDYLCGNITYVISPSKFYFQPKKGKILLEKLMSIIGNNLFHIGDRNVSTEIADYNKVIVKHEGKFMRALILKFPKREENKKFYKVFFIDFGITVSCTHNEFYTAIADTCEKRKSLLKEFFKFPPLCYECKLVNIQPNAIQQYGWSQNVIDYFKSMAQNREIELDLYAFNHYDKVASVEVIVKNNDSNSQQMYMTRTLITLELAKKCSESYITTYIRYNNNDAMSSMRYETEKELKPVYVRDHLLKHKIDLDGPYSVLESYPYPIYRKRELDLSIESSSVQNVLLDQYAYDGVQKVLIASSRSKNEKGIITLRNLTLMPHMIGMASFIGLIFCAYAEVRFDKKMSRCTSILTGLGCDFTEKPYYGEHDCLFRTDVEIDNEDFTMINELRREMSSVLQNTASSKVESRNNICLLLLKLLKKNRIQLSMKFNENIDTFEWNKMKDEGNPKCEQMFSNHQVSRIIPLSFDEVKKMINHIRELDQKAVQVLDNKEIECQLCDETLCLIDLPIHLKNSMHENLKLKYEKLFKKYTRIREQAPMSNNNI